MPIRYTRVGWQDAPSTETPIDAANLNHMDNGILAISQELDTELDSIRDEFVSLEQDTSSQISELSSDITTMQNGLPGMISEKMDDKFGQEIGDNVTSWLTEHVDPVGSAVAVDDTLTIQGSAADAKKTGTLIRKNAWTGVCSTGITTQDKVINLDDATGFIGGVYGTNILVNFLAPNKNASPRLKVGSGIAYPVAYPISESPYYQIMDAEHSAWGLGVKRFMFMEDCWLLMNPDFVHTDSEISDLKEDFSDMDDRVTVLEQGGGGISMTAVNLLDTILSEAVYGTDQTANIALLKNELSKIPPVSISAVLDGTALEGQSYSELDFIVTATFDDESTVVVDDYTLVTTGTVVAGSNTVTIRYRGVTTTCTFTAEAVITYSITYNLSNVTSSNTTSVVVEDSYYSTVLSIPEEYGFDGCTVTMGGVDVTSTVYSNMEILITQVTGNVVISATASAYTYMDNLLRTRSEYNNVNIYSDYLTTKIHGINYIGTTAVSEYPAMSNCTLHWVIENNTENDVSLANVGFGAIPCDANYPPESQNAYFAVPYGIRCTTQSNTLSPGASIEGDYSLRAGHQLVFVADTNVYDSLTLSIRGNYVPNEFVDFTACRVDSTTSYYGGYRNVNFYTDDGTTLLDNPGGYKSKLTDALPAGTYDVYWRLKCDYSRDKIINSHLFGAVTNESDNNSYYACGRKLTLTFNEWFYGRMTITNNNMAVITNFNEQDFRKGGYLDVRLKEVTA